MDDFTTTLALSTEQIDIDDVEIIGLALTGDGEIIISVNITREGTKHYSYDNPTRLFIKRQTPHLHYLPI